jgi:hypothetical protein
MAFDLLNRGGRSSLAFGIVVQQPCRGIGDVQPSVSRDVIFGAAISSLAEKFNRTSAMPSYELASDVFNKIVVVHDRHNSGLTVFAPAAGAKTWLIGRMSRKIERRLGLVHGVE